MSKNLKLNYILSIIFVGIILAWNTLTNFFWGVGINFVAIFLIMTALTFIIMSDKFVRSRWIDVFCLLALLFVLEIPVYFGVEFSKNVAQGWFTYQKVISIICFFFTIYMLFRLFLELKNVRFKFIEVILGNEKIFSKPKRAKEFTNGSLEDKPGTINQASVEIASEEEKQTEEVVVNQENSEE